MKKLELKIDKNSMAKNASGNYIIVLEDSYDRKLPIIVNPADAQFITIKNHNISVSKPLTSEVFKIITDTYHIDIQEVFIYDYDQTIFFVKIITTDGNDIYEVECSISTGLNLSVAYDCPIYITKDLMDKEGIILDDKLEKHDNVKMLSMVSKKSKSEIIDSLNKEIEELLESEEYEKAAQLRDKIESLKSKKNKK
jgi:hypothetical protein